MPGDAAIMIVAGGDDPRRHRWLAACLGAITARTTYPDRRVLVWNNDVGSTEVAELTARYGVDRYDADPAATLDHPHAEGLQHLYEIAEAGGARYVVTFDSDALPVRAGWLTELIAALDDGAALAGVWHEPVGGNVRPYVHPSCLATTVDFVTTHGLRFDDIPWTEGAAETGPRRASQVDRGVDDDVTYDTLSKFTRVAEEAGLPIRKLVRSNRNSLHDLVGGVYGDLVYHHGAGSRRFAPFAAPSGAEVVRMREIRDLGAAMLLDHEDDFLAWLRGTAAPHPIFVLGMHRSGTSALTGCLEQCGLRLGDVSRETSFSQPRGHLEQAPVVAVNEALLVAAGGSWREPAPAPIAPGPEQRAAIDGILAGLEAPGGVKDPRLVLTIEPWLDAAGDAAALVGTFRHPLAVARSLHEREGMDEREALALWRRYNERLVALHRAQAFPLVEFDLSDRPAYCRRVATLAAELGLEPRLHAIAEVVAPASGRTSAPPDTPVPADCAPTYEYLRTHRYRGQPRDGSLVSRLVEWGELLGAPVKLRAHRDLELWAWNVGRHLPRPVKVFLQPLNRAVRRARLRREQSARRRSSSPES